MHLIHLRSSTDATGPEVFASISANRMWTIEGGESAVRPLDLYNEIPTVLSWYSNVYMNIYKYMICILNLSFPCPPIVAGRTCTCQFWACKDASDGWWSPVAWKHCCCHYDPLCFGVIKLWIQYDLVLFRSLWVSFGRIFAWCPLKEKISRLRNCCCLSSC